MSKYVPKYESSFNAKEERAKLEAKRLKKKEDNAKYKAKLKERKEQERIALLAAQTSSEALQEAPVEAAVPTYQNAPQPAQTTLEAPSVDNQKAETIIRNNNNPALNPALALMRCRINNLDPKKSDLPGEIITVGNSEVGTIRKFIPFGEQTENGYHIPKIIYDFLKERRFLNITTSKGKGRGDTINVKQQWLPEFSLEVLPPLSQSELEELAQAQKASD